MNMLETVVARTNWWVTRWLQIIGTPEISEPSEFQNVEFVGGPFDGHVERVQTDTLYQIPPTLEVPVTRAQFDLIEGIDPSHFEPPKAIAHYDLVCHREGWKFSFSHQELAASVSEPFTSD